MKSIKRFWQEFAAAQVSTAARERRDTLVLLAAAALVVAPHLLQVPWWLAAAVCALLAWRAALTLAQHPLPSKLTLLAVLMAAALSVWLPYRTLLGREAGVAFLLLLLGLKFLEMRARRDVVVVVSLCCFLLLTQFLSNQGMGVATLAVVSVLLLFLVLVSVNYEAEDAGLREKLGVLGRLALRAAPLALLLFVFFPRIQGPLWGLPGAGASGTTGLSDSMSPGSLSRVIESEAIAFRARFSAAPPAAGALYWRGPVLGQFDGRTWRPVDERSLRTQPIQLSWAEESALEYEVTLEANRQRWLLVLDVPLATPELAEREVRLNAEFEVLTRQPVDSRLRYSARSATQYRWDAFLPEAARSPWLQLPPDYDPRSRSLARNLRDQLGAAGPDQLDARLVEAVLDHFRTQGFVYTLEPPLLGRNTIDDFLFLTRAGYCENYASSFVFLMRAAGVPARVVTGYQGGEENPADGYFTVRQSDAHAWAEVWLAERGWVRIDPTAVVAPARIDQGAAFLARQEGRAPLLSLAGAPDWLRDLRLRSEALQNAWNQWVLGYTPERQQALARWLGLAPSSQGVVLGLAIGVVLLLGAGAGVSAWRQRRELDPLAAAWLELQARLEAAGLSVPTHAGPRALAQSAKRGLSAEQADELARLCAELEALRYAPMNHDSHTAARVARLRRAIRRLSLREVRS